MDWEEGINKMETNNRTRKPNTELAIDIDDSSNGRFTISTRHHHAPPTRSAPGAPYYFSNVPSETTASLSRPLPADTPILEGWQRFPPLPVPRLDLDDVKRAFGKGLRDVEEFTDQHIQRSTALREVMEEAWVKAKEIQHERKSNGDGDKDQDRDGSGAPPEDRVLFAEMQRMYHSFASIEGCENHASIRRRYSEALKHQPSRTPSKVELLLGSDGSLPNIDLPQGSQLYFLGSPPKLYIIPFDKAAAAGLEGIDSSKPRPSSLPSTLQVGPPQSGSCLPAAPFLFAPPPGKPKNDNIPDWFLHFKTPVPMRGDDLQSRWMSLLNSLGVLEKAIELKDDKPKWDKVWHNPNPKWQYEFRVKKGGWWKCRSGPDAPKVEAECHLCHGAPKRLEQEIDVEARHKEIMDAVNEAMREVAEKDKAEALAMLRQQGQQGKASEYRSWVEEQQENKEKTPEKTAYHRTQGYNLLRGYEGLI